MPMEIAGLEVERVTSGAPARARPILFLHGMWGGSWMWDHYLSFFAGRGYTGYALNLRGHHGAKPVDDIGRVPFAAYRDDARAVAASIGDPIIVGHSMGGLLAQKLAELGDPPAVVALTPAAPRGIFPLCTLVLLRVSLVHLHEFLLGRPIHPTPAEADALLFGRIPPAERRTAFERLVPESGRMAFDVAVAGVPVDAARVQPHDARDGRRGGPSRHPRRGPHGPRRGWDAGLPGGRLDPREPRRAGPRHPPELLYGRDGRRLVDRGADRPRDGRDRGRHV